MPTDKPFLHFNLDLDLLRRIDDFRFERRFESRAAAIKWLLEWALDQNPRPERQQAAIGAASKEASER